MQNICFLWRAIITHSLYIFHHIVHCSLYWRAVYIIDSLCTKTKTLIAMGSLAYGFFSNHFHKYTHLGNTLWFLQEPHQAQTSDQANKQTLIRPRVCSLPPHITYEQCDGLIAMGSLAYGFFSYHFHKYALTPHVSIVHSQLFHFPMMNEDVASLKFNFLWRYFATVHIYLGIKVQVFLRTAQTSYKISKLIWQ